MEKHLNPFDEFLKETLKGHQMTPPEEARKAFLKEASTIIHPRKGWYNWYYLPIIVILLTGIVSVIYFRNAGEPATSEALINENINPGPVIITNSSPILTSTPVLNPQSTSLTETEQTSTSTPISNPTSGTTAVNDPNGVRAIPSPDETTRPGSDSRPGGNAANPAAGNPDVKKYPGTPGQVIPDVTVTAPISSVGISSQHDTLFSETTASRLFSDSLAGPAERKANTEDSEKIALSDSASAMTPAVNPEPQKPVKNEPEHYFAAGAYYLPEWMFNTIEGSKFVNNFGFEGVFYRDRISIRTGLGISMSKGITENAVEYNDYLGSYNKLDSVTFIFNESSHDFLPNFYMSEEKVWDSISKLDSTDVTKRYTYLQVPLVLGFDFWQQGRFAIGVRVGTIMSVMLNSKQLSGEFNAGENQVVGIEMITPDQVSINWQAIGGFNASAALTKSIFFEVEPQAKYYYRSIYEKSGNNKKPWSLSIRTAIIYKFK